MDDTEDRIVARHAQSLGWLLANAHGLYRQRLAEAIRDEPVHMGQVVLLASLFAHNDLTQAQLSKVSGIEKSSVVLFLDALEQDGWIERRRHPSDRRAHLVHLTEAGQARFARLGEKLQTAQEATLSVFTPAERSSFEAYLQRLVDHLNRQTV
jgi:DNA-binding MarR family transcriptional regulator